MSRDITLEDTIYVVYTTRAFATGIPTVLAGTPVISAIENDSATPITAGLTLGVDHASVVGLNLITVAAISQCLVGLIVDVLGDKLHRRVAQRELKAAGVIRFESHGAGMVVPQIAIRGRAIHWQIQVVPAFVP